MSLYVFVTFLIACLHLVLADDGNIAFQAAINITGITVTDPYADIAFAAAVAAPSSKEWTFFVPVTINRYASSAQALALTIFARPYDYDEDFPPEEFVVYDQFVYVYDLPTYDVFTVFNITVPTSDIPVYNFRAAVAVIEGEGNEQSIDGLAVTYYDPEFNAWQPLNVSSAAHQENVVIHAEHDSELAQSVVEPIDTSGETVIRDQDPDLPEAPAIGTVVEPPPEDVTPGTTNPDPTKPDPTKPDPTKPDPTKPDPTNPDDPCYCPPEPEPPKHCRDFHSWRRHNDGKPWKDEPAECRDAWKRNNDGKPWKQDPPPTHPSCPPCPANKHDSHHKRQAAQTILNLNLFYGPSTARVPIRQLKVTAFAIAGQSKISAFGKTDNAGFARFRFPIIGDGEAPLNIYRIIVSLDADKFRVSTSEDNGATFLYWRWRSIPLDWEIDQAGTGTFDYRFMNKASNDVFNVQDRMLNSWVFAKTKVHNFKEKLSNVWFPGEVGPNYFRPATNPVDAYINVHPDKATATSPLAHEYGHWFHYLTRGYDILESGPDGKNHGFCQAGVTSTISALKEGYATAFGISSLWRSRFEQTTPAGGRGTAYCFWPYPATGGSCVEVETYDCDAIPAADRDLSLDEGRVAAVLRDLIDLAGDSNAVTAGNDLGRGATGFSDALSGLSRRKVLYDPMTSNPTSMEEYW